MKVSSVTREVLMKVDDDNDDLLLLITEDSLPVLDNKIIYLLEETR